MAAAPPSDVHAPLRHRRIPMLGRDPAEHDRSATPLELFYDLVFVVAIANAATGLHHALLEGRVTEGVVSYLMVFFGIWWGWVNFTWFASAFDTDDVAYRLATFVQLVGLLVLAAGVQQVFDERQVDVVVAGYVIFRLGLVVQWLRAASADHDHQRAARRYATGVLVVQVAWVVMVLTTQEVPLALFLLLAGVEMAVPVWAEASSPTPWHSAHIAERYGLMTIIVLGESILAGTTAVQAVLADGVDLALAGSVAGAILLVLSMWWLYFDHDAPQTLRSLPVAFAWGYGHYVVYAAVAAVGAGLVVAVETAAHHGALTPTQAGSTVAVPAAVYLLTVWLIQQRWSAPRPADRMALPVGGIAAMACPMLGAPVLAIGLVVAGVVAVQVAAGSRWT